MWVLGVMTGWVSVNWIKMESEGKEKADDKYQPRAVLR